MANYFFIIKDSAEGRTVKAVFSTEEEEKEIMLLLLLKKSDFLKVEELSLKEIKELEEEEQLTWDSSSRRTVFMAEAAFDRDEEIRRGRGCFTW